MQACELLTHVMAGRVVFDHYERRAGRKNQHRALRQPGKLRDTADAEISAELGWRQRIGEVHSLTDVGQFLDRHCRPLALVTPQKPLGLLVARPVLSQVGVRSGVYRLDRPEQHYHS